MYKQIVNVQVAPSLSGNLGEADAVGIVEMALKFPKVSEGVQKLNKIGDAFRFANYKYQVLFYIDEDGLRAHIDDKNTTFMESF